MGRLGVLTLPENGEQEGAESLGQVVVCLSITS